MRPQECAPEIKTARSLSTHPIVRSASPITSGYTGNISVLTVKQNSDRDTDGPKGKRRVLLDMQAANRTHDVREVCVGGERS